MAKNVNRETRSDFAANLGVPWGTRMGVCLLVGTASWTAWEGAPPVLFLPWVTSGGHLKCIVTGGGQGRVQTPPNSSH